MLPGGDLTALDYHYWTQPLPTVFGWWADKSPEWFKHFSTAFVLVVEIVGAFLIWFPRRLRLLGCGSMVFLQIVIGLTGNYAFFNLLTIALCLLLIDDAVWPGALPNEAPIGGLALPRRWVPVVALIVTMPLNALLIFSGFKPEADVAAPTRVLYSAVAPFRIVNGYGLFRVMTKERRGNHHRRQRRRDRMEAYEFKWKPGR